MAKTNAAIIGTGHSLPGKVLTNFDLEKIVETTDEWIVSRTGIRERHISGKDEYASVLAVRAARKAMEMAGVGPGDLDMIVCATISPDMPLPATACYIQAELGAKKAAAFDLAAACSGFIYGLSLAQQYIESGTYRYILIIGVEILSRYVDYADRETCVLFGDGAGAAVVGGVPAPRGIRRAIIGSDGGAARLLYIPGGGTKHPSSAETLAERLHYIKMKGHELFRVAVRTLTRICRRALSEEGIDVRDITLFVPHQANVRINHAVVDRLGLPREKVYHNIDRVGNTSSASIPIALDELARDGHIKRGDLLLLAAFGAGVTSAAAIVEW
jgi:3-oxoacyl-[acyl-carrier-protein] synthase-3